VSTFDLDKFKTRRTKYVTAHGKRMVVETLEPETPARKKRKPFKVEWVKLPTSWVERLEQCKRAATYKLAIRTLCEAFKRRQLGGEIILSAEVTRMPRQTRYRATRELVELGLIEVEQRGKRAVRVTWLLGEPRP
jgi:hypothetical protein